jgi:2-polyprenyl-3-methyl-5-hydroxy-6-metoxy-1,4-benzoquinol methylase
LRLTDKELAEMPAKSTRDREVLALYQDHDFIEAYALHTARRIETTGYQAAIGGGDNWDEHGTLQRDFLISQGLKPEHKLLDIGCGTGRLARKVVPYLGRQRYLGVDISQAAIDAACQVLVDEGLSEHCPAFWRGDIPKDHRAPFDYLWSFSVFIHLPQSIMESVMKRAAGVMHPGSKFYWAYVPEPKSYRSGVKQFRHTLKDYQRAAASAGLSFADVPDWIVKAGHVQGRWSGNQKVAVSRLL